MLQTAVAGLVGLGTVSGTASAGRNVTTTASNGPLVYVGTSLSYNAYDATTGDHVWTFPTEGSSWSSPTVVDGILYAGDNGDDDDDATLYAVDATTGDEIWSFTDPGDWVWSSPTVVDGTVYVGEGGGSATDGWDYSVFAIDAETGDLVWEFDEVEDRVNPRLT